MLNLNSGKFLTLTSNINHLKGVFGKNDNTVLVVDADMVSEAQDIVALLDDLQLPVSKAKAQNYLHQLKTALSAGESADIKDTIHELGSRINDELSQRHILLLTAEESGVFESKTPLFGSRVADKFPSISYEIDEAGKCLALSRSTASAFHSIRCLEAGIRAIARCLGVPDPTKGADRSWFKILQSIKTRIDEKWPNSSYRMSGEGLLFENLYAALAAIQNPWRNSTMHLDAKYTADEAKHIFEAVKGLMAAISSRMDESGAPLA